MQDPRIAIVTGAAKGIGLACVQRFIKDGYHVVLSDIDESATQDAMRRLDAHEGRLIAVQCDVSDRLSVHNLIAETLSAFGQIDVLVNNAAIIGKGGLLETSYKDFDRVLAINLRGAFLVSKAVAAHMAQRIREDDDRSGLSQPDFSIINISSVNDKLATADFLAYTVSKGGLNQLTKAMAIELAPLAIRVNTLSPGTVKTDMLANILSNEDKVQSLHARTPLGRLASPDEIAAVAAFLAGPDSSYVTGETLYVDGGRSALNLTMPDIQA